ncbi:hypothetical protein PENTCL1PPCAC_7573, partial [Pristionchus entomophagus]
MILLRGRAKMNETLKDAVQTRSHSRRQIRYFRHQCHPFCFRCCHWQKGKACHQGGSDSFCMNLFRGKAKVDQVFPYPLNLDQERKETLQV